MIKQLYIVDDTGQLRHIEVSQPAKDSDVYYVHIDNRFKGQLTRTLYGWFPFMNTFITRGDIEVIIELIESRE